MRRLHTLLSSAARRGTAPCSRSPALPVLAANAAVAPLPLSPEAPAAATPPAAARRLLGSSPTAPAPPPSDSHPGVTNASLMARAAKRALFEGAAQGRDSMPESFKTCLKDGGVSLAWNPVLNRGIVRRAGPLVLPIPCPCAGMAIIRRDPPRPQHAG